MGVDEVYKQITQDAVEKKINMDDLLSSSSSISASDLDYLINKLIMSGFGIVENDIIDHNEDSFDNAASNDIQINNAMEGDSGIVSDYYVKKALLKHMKVDKEAQDRIFSALLAREYYQNKHKFYGYRTFTQYAVESYGLSSTSAKEYKQVGERFIVRDSDNLPDLSGNTWLKEKYHLDVDLKKSILIKIITLNNEQIDILFGRYGVNNATTIAQLKSYIDQIKGNTKDAVCLETYKTQSITNSEADSIITFQSWSNDIRKKLFEIELKQRYGITIDTLKKLLQLY